MNFGNLNEEEIAEYKEAFQIFDRNGEGGIDLKDLGKIMRALGLNPSDEEIEEITLKNENINSNIIDFETFLTIMATNGKSKHLEEELIEAFKIFDRDNSGKISAHELRYVMLSAGEDINENLLEEMIREADMDKEGYIDYKKFIQIMLS